MKFIHSAKDRTYIMFEEYDSTTGMPLTLVRRRSCRLLLALWLCISSALCWLFSGLDLLLLLLYFWFKKDLCDVTGLPLGYHAGLSLLLLALALLRTLHHTNVHHM